MGVQQLMQDPVKAPSGHAFDREAILEYIAENGQNPIDSSPLKPEDLVAAPELAEALRLYHFQRLMGVRRL
jgi:hypothetical protein